MAVDFYAAHHIGMDLLKGRNPQGLDQDDDAGYLEARRRRTGAAAADHEKEQQQFGKGRPRIIICRYEARRRNGRDLERSVAEGRRPFAAEGIGQIHHDEERHDAQDKQIGFKLRIAPQDAGPLLIHLIVQAEVSAGQYHEKGNPPFHDGIVEMGHAGIKSRKPAGRNRRQGVVQGIDKIHAAQEENNQSDEGKAGIHAEQDIRHIVKARQHALPRRPGHLGVVHGHGRLARFGQKGDKDDDDSQAAEPVGHAAPKEDAVRQHLQVFNNRRPRAGKPGNTFKEPVEKSQIPAQYIRQHAQTRRQEPAQAGNGNAFTYRQGLRSDVSPALAQKGHGHGRADRQDKGHSAFFAAPEGDAQRDEHSQSLDK